VPELRHLRYFVAVAEELSFSRAARRLHMAQPPLSVAIRQLEQELGTTLLVRSSREVRLTAAGTALLAGARRTLTEADAAVDAARRAGAGETGSLRVAFNWSSGFETVPALGRAFRRRLPDVALLAEEMRNNRMTAALRSNRIDVAVALQPEVAGELSYRPIRREPVVVVLASAHPLAGEDAIALAAVSDEFLLFPRELAPRLHDFFVDLCRRAGFEPRQGTDSARSRWTVGTWDAGTAALFPASVAGHLRPGIVAVRIADPPALLETQAVWRADDASPTVAAFVELAGGLFEPR
jgi:DNA-binding transcriptional LysR family regulator